MRLAEMFFGSVCRHDRFSAETADADGEALFEQIARYAGDFLGLKVQAADSNAGKSSLAADVFKAIKPQEVGTLLRFDPNGKSQAKLGFTFGRHRDGVWADVHMPWATITLMDFDCGSVRNKCEQATPSDHSCHEAVSDDVAVSMNGDELLFKDTMISNAEKNPDSVSLNDVQKSISVACTNIQVGHAQPCYQ